MIEGNRKYLPCLYVYNKIDQIPLEEVDRLARQPHSVVIRQVTICIQKFIFMIIGALRSLTVEPDSDD